MFFALQAALLGLTMSAAASDFTLKAWTEHLSSPLGIDTPHPRFSWMPDSTCRAARQQSWRLVVALDSLSALSMQGKLVSSQYGQDDRVLVRYEGQPLQPRTRYYWRVLANYGDRQADSGVQTFETGLGSRAEWHGHWIGDGKGPDALPAPYFRKTFSVDKWIRR